MSCHDRGFGDSSATDYDNLVKRDKARREALANEAIAHMSNYQLLTQYEQEIRYGRTDGVELRCLSNALHDRLRACKFI